MNLVKIKIDTTSNKTADATGMIIRKNNQFRIVYFPKLVDNSKSNDECIGGYIICQKKSKSEKWENPLLSRQLVSSTECPLDSRF